MTNHVNRITSNHNSSSIPPTNSGYGHNAFQHGISVYKIHGKVYKAMNKYTFITIDGSQTIIHSIGIHTAIRDAEEILALDIRAVIEIKIEPRKLFSS